MTQDVSAQISKICKDMTDHENKGDDKAAAS